MPFALTKTSSRSGSLFDTSCALHRLFSSNRSFVSLRCTVKRDVVLGKGLEKDRERGDFVCHDRYVEFNESLNVFG